MIKSQKNDSQDYQWFDKTVFVIYSIEVFLQKMLYVLDSSDNKKKITYFFLQRNIFFITRYNTGWKTRS